VRSPLELVIFELDDVLVDSERIAVRIDAQVISALGWQVSEAEVIERFMGRTDEAMIREVETQLGRRLPADWEVTYQRLFREAFASELRPVRGVPEGLDGITIPSYVASNSRLEALPSSSASPGCSPASSGHVQRRAGHAGKARPRTCFCKPPKAWARSPAPVPWWRTAGSAWRRLAPQACRPSATRAA
jgi:beta-phosphoglucomutase-like phosphatase (HAD superfamily)